MAQIAKMQVEAEIKASAEKFYEVFRSKGYLLPKICPEMISDLRVIEGDWGTVGSVKQWTYVAAGNSEIAKETVEAMDVKTKSLTFKTVDGSMLKVYKNIKTTVQVTAKGGGCSSVKWSIEYEKLNEDSPPPNKYLDFVVILTKKVDAYLLKA
ncbi:MLP-like protein 28 [Argentina anserina]|uniref:MLP-like protein 28 n=1 Tax=Argentina anserina TaxID=57926 RepID=UPI0021768B69|nr:MLP-like protein 28 [Potentilla anserina]